MPLLEHLEELRSRLFICVLALIIGIVGGGFLAPSVINILLAPIRDALPTNKADIVVRAVVAEDGALRFLNPEALRPEIAPDTEPAEPRHIDRLEIAASENGPVLAVWENPKASGVAYLRPLDPLMIQFYASLLIGVFLAMPVFLWQIYGFVAPGLYKEERNALIPFFVGVFVLFPIGVVFAYYMLSFAMGFLMSFAADDTFFYNDIRAYLSFALTTMAAFGALFQLPLVVLILHRLGIVSVELLASQRKLVFVVLLVIAAVATPPDPFSMLALTLPLYMLFELSLLLARFQTPRVRASEPLADES